MLENQLSGKELYEQRKAEKEGERGGRSEPSSQKDGRGWWPWVIAFLVLAATVFGLYKLATVTPPGGSGATDGALTTPVNESDWTDGSRSAKTQLVEYSDPQCPACAFYAPLIKRLRDEFKTELGVTYRHFPLTTHANAQIAAQVAEAAGLQGKFWPAVDTILDHQKNWADQLAPRESLYQLVGAVGVDLVRMKQDVDSQTVKDNIAADVDSGKKSGVDSTPSFFLNGKRITNPQSYEDFRQLIIDANK